MSPVANLTFPRTALTSPRCMHTGGIPPTLASDGTSATPVITETYISEITVDQPTEVTGIAVFNGSTAGGTDKHFAYITDADGALVNANTLAAGTATSGADSYQRIALTAPKVLAPGTYYICLQMNGTTDRYNAHPFGNFGAGKKTSTVFGTAVAITPPTTFTADLGPMASFY